MANISGMTFLPDPSPTKKDMLKVHLSFSNDEIHKQYVIEITHFQGKGKSLREEFKHGLFLVTANLPDQVFEHLLKNKVSKIGQVPEKVQFIVRIFTLSGRATSNKYDID